MSAPQDDFFANYGSPVETDWVLTPTTYRVPAVGRTNEDSSLGATIDYTGRGWAVHHGNFRLSRVSRLFELCGLPSNRTEEFILETVFATPEEALAFFRECWVPVSPEHPHPYWLRRWSEKWRNHETQEASQA